MPKISIIVPVYKGQRYLNECVDSILAQTYADFELILLDDGSPDNSGKICDDYATRDSRVRVIHKANEGINATRRRGVQEATGEWVAFCDDDDSMPIDALESLAALTDGTDLVIGFPDEPVNRKPLSFEDCRINSITAKRFPPSPWAKLYRRSLFNDHTFDFPREIDGEEDMIMNIRIMFSLNRTPHIVFKKVYNFRRNTLSVSHTKRASIAHEEAFDQARAASIPTDAIEKYKTQIIWSKINGLVGVAYINPKELNGCEYVQHLKDEIRWYNYSMSLQEKVLLLACGSSIVKLVAFLIMIKNAIKYRLGLNN